MGRGCHGAVTATFVMVDTAGRRGYSALMPPAGQDARTVVVALTSGIP